MHSGKFVFTQILDFLPSRDFRRLVSKYRGDYKTSKFSCWDQFLCLCFAQLTFRESLREIEDCLQPRQQQLYHLGLRGSICRSTMADANSNRDWHIYQDFAQLLIGRARKLYSHEKLAIDLDSSIYAIDSTTVGLCLSIFPWAKFRRKKGAIKIHTQLELRGSIPVLIHVSDGKMHDVNWLDCLVYEAGSFYVFDRGYVDFWRLYHIHKCKAFFVTRSKTNMRYYVCFSQGIEENSGVICDQIVRLTNPTSKIDYPEKLRRIVFMDAEANKRLVFITNTFDLSALNVAKLYKLRWQVELFFKWIKQNLRIKLFSVEIRTQLEHKFGQQSQFTRYCSSFVNTSERI